uniref:BHLH domain-containing protein n=1 Tax=Kalanchoe fedtschenkoi TaxID=63787 RepID=A0A7N1A6W3_KALFE
MLSVTSSSSTSLFGWPSDEAVYGHRINQGFYDLEELAAAANADHPGMPGGDQGGGEHGDSRKRNHNASERERRKKINDLYSSLRSLLPASEQSGRMSIPTTVARILKYIPELQGEVERLERKKQAMSKKINKVRESVFSSSSSKLAGADQKVRETDEAKASITRDNSNRSSILTSKVWDRELVIQISTLRVSVSEILLSLEEDGFQLINASSSESFSGRVFLNLHLQKVDVIRKMECEGLDEKLLSMLEKRR